MLKLPTGAFLRKCSSFPKHKAQLCKEERERDRRDPKTTFMYMLHPVTVDTDI